MASLATALEALSAHSPAQWCQIFFGLSSAAVLAIQAIPKAAQHAILDYGARSPAGADGEMKGGGRKAANRFDEFVKAVASVGQIPHAWFMHFYVASIVGSAFWAFEYVRDGPAYRFIASRQAQSGGPAMSLEQTVLVWTLMLLQGSRRLYECLFVMKPGSSRMWFVHWLLGLGFYISSLISTSGPKFGSLLTPTSVIGIAMYLYGWTNQHWCHKHLAGLKKYSLPDQGLFRYLVCPHYTCECVLYLGLAILAAPRGQWINRTILCAFWFIVANLGTTADGTKQWYAQKFGAEKPVSLLSEQAKLGSEFRYLHYIAVREARSGRTDVSAVDESVLGSQKVPIHDGLGGQLDILIGIGNAVKVIGVEAVGGDEKASGFLQNAPYRLRIQRSALFGLIEIQTQARSQADSAHDWMIGSPVL
ncbi:3-oxo-5-alpha-steroid 4-dehydrogenase [Colletotrichum karsti]|uniref:Polyprenal reductase n=1 Tax=Colletotrichum karsti TaxID=1095194 RepID=A0A9P6I0F7_9PEZI|nr:3-oxo-5-alpha-steroid 4-dehydrogenase [Colletotrichum karsti]KAF9871716.1 3-oxo-5-alpha-steroid 4-dehydrogenase [Colletotrichum karsti]